ncbi:Group XV phospholipase A2, partial [Trichinella nelsoni]
LHEIIKVMVVKQFKYYFVYFVVTAVVLYAKPFQRKVSRRSPVIIVPGDGGNQLEARLNKTETVHYFCQKKTSDYFTLWLNLELLVPFVLDCWVDNMRLEYDEITGKTSNSPGVDIRVPGWGNTTTVEFIDPSGVGYGDYFSKLINKLVTWGYTRGVDVRAAPYDFRKAPNHNIEYFENLKSLIEETYYSNGNSKVVTIGHSLGNLYLLYFFNLQSPAWKAKFIKSHVSVSAPYGGSVKILKAFASGYNLDQWKLVLNPLTIRKEQRSMTSSAFLLPSTKLWSADEVLVTTVSRNYTAYDYKEFFNDIGFKKGWSMYKNTRRLLEDLKAPGVEVICIRMTLHCLYGVDIPTAERLVYGKGKFPDSQPIEINGDGDGTVGIRSLAACMDWVKEQEHDVHVKTFPKAEHTAILKFPEFFDYIKNALFLEKKRNITLHVQAEYCSKRKCVAAGFGYFLTQLIKMLILATFFPTTDQEGVQFHPFPELMKAMVDVLDVIGLYVVINRNWSGKGDARFLAAGLGWSSADSLATRVVPFWTGARGTTFSWKYIQMCLESNYNLVYYVALATFLWLWTRREIPSFMKIALRSILTFAVFKAFLKDLLMQYYGISSWILLIIHFLVTVFMALMAMAFYAVQIHEIHKRRTNCPKIEDEHVHHVFLIISYFLQPTALNNFVRLKSDSALLNKMNSNGDNNKHNHSNLMEKIKPKKRTFGGQNDEKLAEADGSEQTLKSSSPRHSSCKNSDKSPEETSQRSNHFLWRFRSKDATPEKEDLNKTGTNANALRNTSPVDETENSHMGSNQVEALRSPSSNFGGFFHRFRQRTRSESTPTEDHSIASVVDASTNLMHKMSIVDEDSVMEPSMKNTDERPLTKILSMFSCFDLMPKQGLIVSLDTNLTIHQTLVAMLGSGALSALIWDSDRHSNVGVMTLTNLLGVMLNNNDDYRCWLDRSLKSWMSDPVKSAYCPNLDAMVTLHSNAKLIEAITLLSSSRLHRIPITDTYSGNFMYMLSMWSILKFLHQYLSTLPLPQDMYKPLDHFKFGTWENVHRAKGEDTVSDVLHVLLNNRISCLPVVQVNEAEEETVLNIITKVDIVNYLVKFGWKNLRELTVNDIVNCRSSTVEGMVTCHRSVPLLLVIDLFVRQSAHRLIIVDSMKHLVGVISIADLLFSLIYFRKAVVVQLLFLKLFCFALNFTSLASSNELMMDDMANLNMRTENLVFSNVSTAVLHEIKVSKQCFCFRKEKLNLMRSSVLWSSNKASILQYNYLNDIPFKLNDRFAPIPSLPLGDCEPEVKLKTELLERDVNFELEKRILCSELAAEGTGYVCPALLQQQNGPGCSDSAFSSEMTRCRSLPDFKGLHVPFPSYSKVLEPTRSNDLKSSVVERSPECQLDVDAIEEFEPVESTPFDAIQLNTIDDLEELRLVLECAKQNEKQENILARSSHHNVMHGNAQTIFRYSPIVRPWFGQNENSSNDLSYMNINAPAGFNPLTSSFSYLEEADRMNESDGKNA